MDAFYRQLRDEGYGFNLEVEGSHLEVDINFESIYAGIFSDRANFLAQSHQFTLDHETDFEENYNLREEIIQIIEKYERE